MIGAIVLYEKVLTDKIIIVNTSPHWKINPVHTETISFHTIFFRIMICNMYSIYSAQFLASTILKTILSRGWLAALMDDKCPGGKKCILPSSLVKLPAVPCILFYMNFGLHFVPTAAYSV